MQSIFIASIFGIGLVAFASARIRHDLVAVLMLLTSVALGLVAPEAAISGLGDPVVVTVAAVMAISATIARSGILRLALAPFRSALVSEIGICATFCIFCAVASGFMNNVGALALLLPAALSVCRSSSISPSRILMPMAFSSLLGGLVTLIGTPPNIIVSEIRETYVGRPFSMFDFAPVGGILALLGVGVILVSLRLLPRRVPAGGDPLLFKISDYLFELRVPRREPTASLTIDDLTSNGKNGDKLLVHAIDRGGIVFAAPAGWRQLRSDDIIQVEGRAPSVQVAIEQFGLEIVGGKADDVLEAALFECVVSARSQLESKRDAREQLSCAGAALLAVSRRERGLAERLGEFAILPGDVVLLQAPESLKPEIIEKFGLLPLAERAIELGNSKIDWRPAVALAAAIALVSLHIMTLSVALIAVLALLAIMGRVSQKVYDDIDWSIIILLAAIIPVAHAFTKLGAGDLISTWLEGLDNSYPSYLVIVAALGATMLVTPFVNNAAAVLIMAPIAAKVGRDAGVNVDAMLMAVAIGASCEFLTPIGHQSNTLVMGPGGYRFLDYPRLGIPLFVTVLIVGSLLINAVWS